MCQVRCISKRNWIIYNFIIIIISINFIEGTENTVIFQEATDADKVLPDDDVPIYYYFLNG